MGLEGITMNREIKFRIWDVTFKSFDYIELKDGRLKSFSGFSYEEPDDGLIFQQFTGLKDITGREIYEGDIIKDLDEENLIIEFQNGSFIANGKTIIPFWSMLVKNELVQPAMVNSQTFEVVGNVFENTELLK